MDYLNFDLWVNPGVCGGYPLRANCDVGEVTGALNIDAGCEHIQHEREMLVQRKTDEHFLTTFGTELYEALFKGSIDKNFYAFCKHAQIEKKGVRLRLKIEPDEIASLPWEFLYNPTDHSFLGTQVDTAVVRYQEIDRPFTNLEAMLPLKMLVAIPDYRGSPLELNTDEEKNNLLQALNDLKGVVDPVFLEGKVTLDTIADALLKQTYHCFHFIGHGDFQDDEGCLLLNTDDDQIVEVGEERFTDQFLNHPGMKLVVLNSCKGAAVSSNNALVGIAPKLVFRGIPAVIAMQFSIYDEAAVLFSRVFYTSLFNSRKNKGWVESAVSEARLRLKTQYPDQRELGTPVLFMRTIEGGPLFDPITGNRFHDMLITNERWSELARQHTYNISYFEESRNTIGGPQIEEDLSQAKEELARLNQRFKLRNQCIGIASVTFILMIFLSWVSLFDFVRWDTNIESYTIWLGDLFTEKNFSDKIVIVPIKKETEKMLNKSFDRSWRQDHAVLIEKMSKAGARVIAFDMYFNEASDFDQVLIDAIGIAKKRNTTVILGYRELEGDRPVIVPSLRKIIPALGIVCHGEKLGYARTAPLVISKDNQTPLPSLALAIFMADRGVNGIKVDWDNQFIYSLDTKADALKKLKYSERTESAKLQKGCPVIDKGDDVADLLLGLSSLPVLRDPSRNFAYEKVKTATDLELNRQFMNKIVIVGVEKEEELFSVHADPKHEYYGLELHAEALNNLLQGKTIQSLDVKGQLLIMVVLSFLGAFIKYWELCGQINKPTLVLLIILIVYLVITVFIYSQYRVLLNTLYHIVALLFAYWATGKIAQKYFTLL